MPVLVEERTGDQAQVALNLLSMRKELVTSSSNLRFYTNPKLNYILNE